MTKVWSVQIKHIGQMARQYKENPNPDGEMKNSVIKFILVTFDHFFHLNKNPIARSKVVFQTCLEMICALRDPWQS